MVLCVVLGCSRRSGRDTDVSFFRIPKVITKQGKDIENLSRKRRIGFLSVIKRENLTDKILLNDRICSRHFISGKPASLLDEINPDWLPSLHLGNSKSISESSAKAALERWERIQARQNQDSCGDKCENDENGSSVNGSRDFAVQVDLTTLGAFQPVLAV